MLSVAAAIPTATIERHLASGVPVVRAMPNTPSTVHEGIAGLCAGAHADDAHVTLAEEALAHLGAVVRVPERSMDAVTAVSGSGPAYFALLAEAMIEAGLLLGLSREISTQLVVQTMLGTAKQLRDEKMHPVELREMVTSPGRHDDRRDPRARVAGVRAAFLNAIQAAMNRAKELDERADGPSRAAERATGRRLERQPCAPAPARRARAPCPRRATSSRNASRSSNERSTSRRAVASRVVVTARDRRERLADRGGLEALGDDPVGDRRRLAVAARGRAAPAPRSSRRSRPAPRARPRRAPRRPPSRAPARSPAIRRQRRMAIGRPQLAGGAAAPARRVLVGGPARASVGRRPPRRPACARRARPPTRRRRCAASRRSSRSPSAGGVADPPLVLGRPPTSRLAAQSTRCTVRAAGLPRSR